MGHVFEWSLFPSVGAMLSSMIPLEIKTAVAIHVRSEHKSPYDKVDIFTLIRDSKLRIDYWISGEVVRSLSTSLSARHLFKCNFRMWWTEIEKGGKNEWIFFHFLFSKTMEAAMRIWDSRILRNGRPTNKAMSIEWILGGRLMSNINEHRCDVCLIMLGGEKYWLGVRMLISSIEKWQ